TQSAFMPTAAERSGDFSRASTVVRDPRTSLPFPGNIVPADRISPQAAALLAYYPLPNGDGTSKGANYQTAVVTTTRQDGVQFGLNKAVNRRDTLDGTFGYRRTVADTTTLFNFDDENRQSSVDAGFTWSRRFSLRLTV